MKSPACHTSIFNILARSFSQMGEIYWNVIGTCGSQSVRLNLICRTKSREQRQNRQRRQFSRHTSRHSVESQDSPMQSEDNERRGWTCDDSEPPHHSR